VAVPASAAAQHSLTGHLVEQLPGGGALSDPEIFVYRVVADVRPELVAELETCSGGSTTNCIDGAGVFTITNLATATYLLRIQPRGTLYKAQSVVVAGNTNLGDIPLIRMPFTIDVAMGSIPATGGAIPVTLRARATWAVPTLPLVVRIQPFEETASTGNVPPTPTLLYVTWPAGFADTGVLPFTTLNVSPDAPAGSENCVNVEIRLQSSPNVVLGGGGTCSFKQP
jgi:hypothetical protein